MHTHIDADFGDVLGSRFRVEDFDPDPASVFGLWPDSRLAYFNSAWTTFAAANGGQPAIGQSWGLGARYLDAIAEPLRPFYRGLLAGAPEPESSRHPVAHQYECSSATRFRMFNMQVYALPERAGFIVVNSLVVEVPHDPDVRPPQAAEPQRYLDAQGTIVQCCHCRRVRRGDDPAQWDWVPAWVERSPTGTSHGICAICLGYYYPAVAP
jgi:hypothetical protein